MSTAAKCDRCGALYTPQYGNVAMDVSVMQKDAEISDTWSDVDLCQKCSSEFLRFIKPALNDLDPELGN